VSCASEVFGHSSDFAVAVTFADAEILAEPGELYQELGLVEAFDLAWVLSGHHSLTFEEHAYQA
jgi:hypothetical protein